MVLGLFFQCCLQMLVSKVRAKSAPEILKTTKTTCASIKQYREALETLRSFCIPIGNGPSLKTGKVRSPIGNRARKTKVCSRTRKPQHTTLEFCGTLQKLSSRGGDPFQAFSEPFTFKAAKRSKWILRNYPSFPYGLL